MAAKEKWSERLDELNKKVNDGFARVDADIRELRTDMDARFDKVDARFEKVDERLAKLEEKFNDRFDALNRNLLSCAMVVIAAIIGSNVF